MANYNTTTAGIGMGIGALGGATFKRKYRWTFQVTNIGGPTSTVGVGGQYVKVANRPQVEVEETEINFLNGKTWIPGKATFQSLSVTYYDVAASDGAVQGLLNWVNRVYNFQDGKGDGIYATQANVAIDPTGNTGYAGIGKLSLLDGSGYNLETWTLYNCWPQSINFGDLDYSSSEECTIELTLRYSYAKYLNYCAKPLPVPNAPACAGSIAGNY